MTVETSGSGTAQSRWLAVVKIVPWVVLGVMTTLTAFGGTGIHLVVDLGLWALCGLWMLVMFALRPAWRDSPTRMAVFVVGLIVITAALVSQQTWFGAFAIACYIYVFALIRWPWQLLALAASAVFAGIAQSSPASIDSPTGWATLLLTIAVNILGIGTLATAYHSSLVQSDRSRRALEQASEANRRLEQTLAENARLHDQLLAQARQAGMLYERQRMAREIHDTLAQGLVGIITQLQAASADSDRHVQAAIALARDSLTDARRSVDALRPGPLEQARLAEALASIAERWQSLNGIPVQTVTTGDALPVDPSAEDALLRTAQEALANVARHARAARAGITLSYLDREVVLDVRDDGVGFAASSGGAASQVDASSDGFGLIAMRERIEGAGGILQIESEPGGGTTVHASIPLSFAASSSPASSPMASSSAAHP